MSSQAAAWRSIAAIFNGCEACARVNVNRASRKMQVQFVVAASAISSCRARPPDVPRADAVTMRKI